MESVDARYASAASGPASGTRPHPTDWQDGAAFLRRGGAKSNRAPEETDTAGLLRPLPLARRYASTETRKYPPRK
ncbi:hypothetical protein [Hymenobacter sp. HSC-4F20]|uniref:hypothetical protein n=1 Tax=Hymenobacter sp. HSC-4F20 TaxID=2864135 RepID=UPI001C733864|nr:hypothetical protein [Hymenobacter sp. HSC-4F20]